METLGEDELACLQGIAAGQSRTAADCRPGVLQRLQRRGLVLQRPQRSLPLENSAHDYILSTAGGRLLERYRSGK